MTGLPRTFSQLSPPITHWMETEAEQEIYELWYTTAVCVLSLFWFISSNQEARRKQWKNTEEEEQGKKKRKNKKEIMRETVIFRILKLWIWGTDIIFSMCTNKYVTYLIKTLTNVIQESAYYVLAATLHILFTNINKDISVTRQVRSEGLMYNITIVYNYKLWYSRHLYFLYNWNLLKENFNVLTKKYK